MGVFDNIPLWARIQPAEPVKAPTDAAIDAALKLIEAYGPPFPKPRGRPKGAKDGKPRARLATTAVRPENSAESGPLDGNTSKIEG